MLPTLRAELERAGNAVREQAAVRAPLAQWRSLTLAAFVPLVFVFWSVALPANLPNAWYWRIPLALAVTGLLVASRGGIADRVRAAWARGRRRCDDPSSARTWIGPCTASARARYSLLMTIFVFGMFLIRVLGLSGATSSVATGGLILCLLVLHGALHWRHGRLVVHWPRPPVRRGEPVTFSVGVTDGGARIDDVWCVLRCFRQERMMLGLHGVDAEVWSAPVRIAPELHVGPDTEVVATFHPPADLPPSDLLAHDPVAWELVVLGTVGGKDYAGRVTVPVA